MDDWETQENFLVTPEQAAQARKRERRLSAYAVFYAVCGLVITASISIVVVKFLGLH